MHADLPIKHVANCATVKFVSNDDDKHLGDDKNG